MYPIGHKGCFLREYFESSVHCHLQTQEVSIGKTSSHN